MSQWAELRHQHFVDGVPKKALARRYGLDVKTVRRALDRAEPPMRAAALKSTLPSCPAPDMLTYEQVT